MLMPTSVANKFQTQSIGLGEFQNLYKEFINSTWTQPINLSDGRELGNYFNRTGFDLITNDAFSSQLNGVDYTSPRYWKRFMRC